MADRLHELLQQRALLKEHLAWLESEIAAASGRPVEIRDPAPPPVAVPARPTMLPVVTAVVSPRKPDDADALLAELAAQEKSPLVPSKKGCWIFFCAALGLCCIGAWVALHFFYRG
jgi:hypothetical protein